MKLHNSILLSFMFLFAEGFSIAQSKIPGIENITQKQLMETVNFLCQPDLDGRQPGSTGYKKAADFISGEFNKLGLIPMGSKGYFQEVPVEYTEITGTPVLELLSGSSIINNFVHGTEFTCRANTGSGDVTANVVFCGYGISEPDKGYDDYQGMDVNGKIVMVFKQNPSWKIEGVNYADILTRYKTHKAIEHGALAVIFVSVPNVSDPQKPIGSLMDGKGIYEKNIPQLQIDIPTANEFLAGTSYNLSQLEQRIDSLKQPFGMNLKMSGHVKVESKYYPEKTSWNVVGMLKGSSSLQNKEYIVLGAHLDHVGRQGNDLYYPGANDDASGSAAVLQMARAFVNGNVRPERSVIFVLFTSEEQGLNGSEFFAKNLPVLSEQIVAMFNLDCIGSGDSIQVGSGKSSPLLWNIARKADSVYTKKMVAQTWSGGGADATPFFNINIPTLYFVSKYSYTHLHLPTDTPETLNGDLFEKIVKLAYIAASEVLQGGYLKEPIITAP